MGKQQINPIAAVVIVVVILAGVGFLGMKLLGKPATGNGGTEVRVTVNNPNDPRYKPDPKLAGGN